jgi:hypothetical protein
MRSAFVALVCVLLSLVAAGQTNNLPKDPQAISLVQNIIAASGLTVHDNVGSETLGTITLAGDNTPHPIRILTLGNNRSRIEIGRSQGKSIRVLNMGRGIYQSESGTVTHLNPLNTLSARIEHMPVLSLMSDYASPSVKLDYIGPGDVYGTKVVQFSASWSSADNDDDQRIFLSRTKVTYSIDPQTFRIVVMDYDRAAENDSKVVTHYRVIYGPYRREAGKDIPQTVSAYANNVFSSEIKIASFKEDDAISQSEFDMQGVGK